MTCETDGGKAGSAMERSRSSDGERGEEELATDSCRRLQTQEGKVSLVDLKQYMRAIPTLKAGRHVCEKYQGFGGRGE